MANVYRALIQGLIGLLQTYVKDGQKEDFEVYFKGASSMDLVAQLANDYLTTSARVKIQKYTLADILEREAAALDEYLNGTSNKSVSLCKAVIWQTIANESIESA